MPRTGNLKKDYPEFGEWINRELAKLPERIRVLISVARFDVLFGPQPEGEDIDGTGIVYPGFEAACDEIGAAIDTIHCDEVWSDGGYMVTSEPEGWEDEETGEWTEPYWGDIILFTRSDVRKAMVGEVADYL